jgi:hypothetical protein
MPDHPGAQRIVGDEENPPFKLTAGNGFGHVVQQGSEAQGMHAVFSEAGVHPTFFQLALDAADDLDDVVQGIQVVVRAPFQFTGEGELGDGVEEPDGMQRGFEDRAKVQWFSAGGGSSCGSYWGWDVL